VTIEGGAGDEGMGRAGAGHAELEARTIVAMLDHARAHHPDREVLVRDGERTTFGEIDRRSSAIARRLLAAGVGKGAKVGALFGNDADWVATWLGITRIGAIAVGVNTFSTPRELRNVLAHADIELLITTDRFLNRDYGKDLEEALPGLADARGQLRLPAAPYLRSVWMRGEVAPWASPMDAGEAADTELLEAAEQQVTAADALMIVYTSGSMAAPKGVLHSHYGGMTQMVNTTADIGLGPHDRTFTPMPFFWVGGLFVLLPALYTGGAVLVSSATDGPSILDFAERERATVIFCWPHTAKAMAEDPTFAQRDLTSVRTGHLYAAYPEHSRPADPSEISTVLGMTETCGAHTQGLFHHLPDGVRGAFGTPMPGMEHRVVDPATLEDLPEGELGEILVRGATLMMGIYKRARHETFTTDGWYRTGDTGYFRGGYLYYQGRLDDMIKAGGSNVSPREVEEVLLAVDGVAQAFVAGIADPERGAVVAAAVVPKPGVQLDPTEVKAAAAAQLSAYKRPAVVRVVAITDIPQLTSGKVDRNGLVELLARGAAAAR
jgi:acyl-CoA synthetase (AMP-forming)/AMP-acid ligase II